MSKLTIDSVCTKKKKQLRQLILNFENEYPTEDFESNCAIFLDDEGNRMLAAEMSGRVYAGDEETPEDQTFILAKNRITGKVRLIKTRCAVLRPVKLKKKKRTKLNKLENTAEEEVTQLESHTVVSECENGISIIDEKIINNNNGVQKDLENDQVSNKVKVIPLQESYKVGFESQNQLNTTGVINDEQTNNDKNIVQNAVADELDTNVQASERNIYICDDCETVFTEKDSLICHMTSHNFKQNDVTKLSQTIFSCDENFNGISNEHVDKNSKIVESSNVEKINDLNRKSIDSNSNTEKKFICDYCQRVFQRKPWFVAHITSHQSKKLLKKYSCSDCTQIFSKKSDLINHEIKQHELFVKYYSCPDCDYKTTTSSYKLTLHMTTHLGISLLNCKTCGYETNDKSNLKKHILTHTQERPFNCKMCVAKFRQSAHLKKHMKSHYKIAICKSDTCIRNDCGVSFKSKTLLIEHIQSHDKDTKDTSTNNIRTDTQSEVSNSSKTKSCNICEFKTAYASQLTIHMRTHQKIQPFKCSICDYACQKRSDLTVHSRTHTGEKPFQCTHCDAKFAKKNGLTRHLNIHTGDKIHKCPHCDAQFKLLNGLKRHLIIHTKEKPYKCDSCISCFSDVASLKRHMRAHTGVKPFKCAECEYCSANNHDLKRHMKTHGKLIRF